MKLSFVYILECSDGTYYTGVTSNLEKRVFEHKIGRHQNSYTFSRKPLKLVFFGNLRTLIWQSKRKNR